MQLEKEAINNGTSPGQAHDIDIPPPRPKRKPNCPYPRKGCLSSETPTREVPKSSVSLSNSNAEMASNGTLQVNTHCSIICFGFSSVYSILDVCIDILVFL